MTPPATPQRNRWLWLVAGLLLVLEFFVFERLAAHRQAMMYPRWSDQIQYLSECYLSYDELKAHGWLHGLAYACTNPAAQGTLHDIVAVVAFGVFGPSRTVALDLNMLAFIAWQAVTLFAIRRLTGSTALGWLGFGLLLCLAGPWTGDAGSAVDFRLDHAAMCFWGIAATTALLTRGFRDLRWSLVFGGAAGLTIVGRFLTGAYFAPVFLAVAVWIFCGEDRARRLRNLALAGLVAFVLAAPFFWMHRAWIFNYYWHGHFTNAENAAREAGLGFWASLAYVGGNFWDRHVGWVFGGFALLISLIPLLLESFWDRMRTHRPELDRDWLFTGFVFLFAPAAVLCLHGQKSEYVLGIVAPGLVLLLLWLWRLELPEPDGRLRPAWPQARTLVAGAAVLLGLGYFGLRQAAPPYDARLLADSHTVDAFVDRLYAAAAQNPTRRAPRIGVDQIMDSLDAVVLRVIGYERHHAWLPMESRLPISILAADPADIFQRLAECDYFFLTDDMRGNGYWPYDHQMRALYPQLKAWCDAHLERTETFSIFEKEISLYQRRPIP